jgi:hypothetical protein
MARDGRFLREYTAYVEEHLTWGHGVFMAHQQLEMRCLGSSFEHERPYVPAVEMRLGGRPELISAQKAGLGLLDYGFQAMEQAADG